MTAAARKAFEDAVALEDAGQIDKALVSYLKAQELSPEDTEIAYRTASALLRTGYLEEAQSQLRRIVFVEPDHLDARTSLGNCQLLMGDTLNARQNFAEVLSTSPGNRNALYGLASVLLKENEPADAAVAARRLVELLPDSPAALTLFADTQARTEQMAAAIAAYRKALKADPDYGPALIGLSRALLLRKRYDEVIDLAVRASEKAASDAEPLELLSDALLGKGALQDACEAAEAAVRLAPDAAPNRVRLSVLRRKLGDYAGAMDHALRAHDIDKSAKAPLNALGSALATLKKPDQARSVLTGMATGKGLDPAVRRTVEVLIASARSETESPESQPVPIPEMSSECSAADRAVGIETTSQVVPKPAGDGLDPRGDHLPNVLGLRRQDRS